MPIALILAGWVFPLTPEQSETWAHLVEFRLAQDLTNTFAMILLVIIMAGALGVGAAWIIARYEFPLRATFAWALVLPFAVPSYILATSYGDLLEYAGPIQSALRASFGWEKADYVFPNIRSVGGAAIILALATYAYVYLMMRAAFERQPEEWRQLSLVFGHERPLSFLRLSLAAARPFLIIGMALALMETAADIGVAELYGIPTLATGLYRIWYHGGDPLLASRMATVLLILAAALLTIERMSRSRARFGNLSASRAVLRTRIEGWRGWLAMGLCAIPVLVGFVIPVLWTIRYAFFTSHSLRLEKILNATGESLMLSVGGALLIVAAALVMSLAERARAQARIRAEWVASLGYAVPGVVIAMSLLFLQSLIQTHLGIRLVMTGSILGLLLAYLIRFLSPAYQSLHAGFLRIPNEIDMVSQSFGKSKAEMVRRVYLPLLRNPMIYAFLLVAIDIFKELPASLILRPFDIHTLAIAVYEFSGDDRPAEAAPYALVLIAVSLLAVYALARSEESGNERTQS